MSDSLADDSRDVLDKVKADGTFDQMRLRATEAIKKSVSIPGSLTVTSVAQLHMLSHRICLCPQGSLTQLAEELVASTEIFSSGKAESLSRKELFEHIRKNHE